MAWTGERVLVAEMQGAEEVLRTLPDSNADKICPHPVRRSTHLSYNANNGCELKKAAFDVRGGEEMRWDSHAARPCLRLQEKKDRGSDPRPKECPPTGK